MTSTLDQDTVRRVAHLARLRVSDEEVAQFVEQLSQVLDYVAQLNEVDTAQVPPMTHPLPVRNVFRDDVPRDCWDSHKALQNAPGSHEAFFRVPKVLDQGGE